MLTISYRRWRRTGPSKAPAGSVISPAGSLAWLTTGRVVGSAMDLRLHCRPEHDDATARARHRAPHEHQVLGRANGDHLDVLCGHPVGPVLAGHALVLEHAA